MLVLAGSECGILNSMKTLPAISSALALLIVSCTSPLQRRIEKNPQIYASLSEHQKSLVQRGDVEEGMSKEAVFLSWGKPDRVASGTKQGKAYERWSYTGYESVPVMSAGFGFGYWGSHRGYRGVRSYVYADPFYYGGPAFDYVPYEAARAEFVNTKLSAWTVAH